MVKDIRKGYNWKSSHRFEDIWKEVNFESYKKKRLLQNGESYKKRLQLKKGSHGFVDIW